MGEIRSFLILNISNSTIHEWNISLLELKHFYAIVIFDEKNICLFILGDTEIGNLLNDSDSDQDFEIETKSSKKRTASKATPAKTVPKSTTKSTLKAKVEKVEPKVEKKASPKVIGNKYNSYKKVIVCLSVPKDLANCLTVMVLLYRVAPHS